MNLQTYCTELEKHLEALPEPSRPARAAQALQSAFKVSEEEIAIFKFDPRMEVFHFSWPPLLQTSGIVPLKANNSLVAKTGRGTRGYLDNHFNKTAHTFIFEFVQDKKDKNQQAAAEESGGYRPIQKIMSVPLHNNGQLRGVIQVSRKGSSPQESGADFQKPELAALQKIGETLARLL